MLVVACAVALAGCGARSGLAVGGSSDSCASPSCSGSTTPGSALWSRLYSTNDERPIRAATLDVANTAAIDEAGDIFLAGQLFAPDTVDFGCGPLRVPTGPSAAFLVRLDGCGTCAWSTTVPNANVSTLALRDGILAVGGVYAHEVTFGSSTLADDGDNTVWVGALRASDGAPLWAVSLGDPSAASALSGVNTVAIDAAGNILVAADTTGTVTFGGSTFSSGGFLGMLRPDGSAAWGKAFGANSTALGVATDDAGDVFVAGGFETPIDLGCGALEGRFDEAEQPYVAAFDTTGACLWSRSFQASIEGSGGRVGTDASSHVVVTGTFDTSVGIGPLTAEGPGGLSVFVASLDADGTPRWLRGLPGFAGPAIVAPSGNVFAAGSNVDPSITTFAGGPVDGGASFGILGSLDENGSYRWARAFATQTVTEAMPAFSDFGLLAVDRASRVVVPGSVGPNVDFGCGAASIAGEDAISVAVYAQ